MNTEDSEFQRIEREQAMRGVPKAITDDSESPEYRTGWNDCRAAMLAAQPAPVHCEAGPEYCPQCHKEAQPAQRKPLTPTLEADTGYSRAQRAAFIEGWEEAESAHNIKAKQS